MSGPEVPFPLKQLQDEPGVPFPFKAIDEVMCRDCPFPRIPVLSQEAQEALGLSLQEWKDDVLRTAHAKITGSLLEDLLKGRELLVLTEGQGAPFDKHFNRLIVRVDNHNIITHVQEGV